MLHRADPPTVQRLVGDLQQTHGNAYVNRLLTVQRADRKGAATAAPPATAPQTNATGWNISYQKRGQAAGLDRTHVHSGSTDSLKLFMRDVLVVTATAPAGGTMTSPSVRSERTFTEETSPGPQPAPATSPGTVKWEVDFEHLGEYSFAFDVGDGSPHTVKVEVVLDQQGLKDQCDLAKDALDIKYHAVRETLEKAYRAYDAAYDRQEKDLKDAMREERIPGDILEGLLFAAIGGAAGGAAGELLKTWLGNAAKGVVGAAITDLGKDMVKYTARSYPKLRGSTGSAPDTSGDSVAQPSGDLPATGGSGRESAAGERPSQWISRLNAALEGEATKVLQQVLDLKQAAVDARNVGRPTEFAVDPYELATRNRDMETVAAQLSTDHKFYLSFLWHSWLERFAWRVVWMSPGSQAVVGNQVVTRGPYEAVFDGPKVRSRVMAAAAECGENGQDWINMYKGPAAQDAEERNRRAWGR